MKGNGEEERTVKREEEIEDSKQRSFGREGE